MSSRSVFVVALLAFLVSFSAAAEDEPGADFEIHKVTLIDSPEARGDKIKAKGRVRRNGVRLEIDVAQDLREILMEAFRIEAGELNTSQTKKSITYSTGKRGNDSVLGPRKASEFTMKFRYRYKNGKWSFKASGIDLSQPPAGEFSFGLGYQIAFGQPLFRTGGTVPLSEVKPGKFKFP